MRGSRRPNRGGGKFARGRGRGRGRGGGRGGPSDAPGPPQPEVATIRPLRRDLEAVDMTPEQQDDVFDVLQQRRQEVEVEDRSEQGFVPAPTLLNQLSQLGFKEENSIKGLRAVNNSDLPSALDWMCLNLPEDQLPPSFASASGKIKVYSAQSGLLQNEMMASTNKDGTATKFQEASVERLMAKLGFDRQKTIEALGECHWSETEAIVALLTRDLGDFDLDPSMQSEMSEEERAEMLGDEVVACESIFGEDFRAVDPSHVIIKVPIEDVTETCEVHLFVPPNTNYPNHPLVGYLECTEIPKQVRYELQKKMGEIAIENVGQPSLYTVGWFAIEWIQTEWERIKEKKEKEAIKKKMEDDGQSRQKRSNLSVIDRTMDRIKEKELEEQRAQERERRNIEYLKKLMAGETPEPISVPSGGAPKSEKDNSGDGLDGEGLKDESTVADSVRQKLSESGGDAGDRSKSVKEAMEVRASKEEEEKKSEKRFMQKNAEQLSRRLSVEAEKKKGDPKWQAMQASRSTLPAAKLKDDVVKIVRDNQVVVISGETGCGKTTQVPQFILEDAVAQKRGGMCRIICTQPRRISAMGVAERVADEMCEKIGDGVGYQIRMEAVKSQNTRLLFCTTGILLRFLQGDRHLVQASHIIVDEVHERDINSDFLLVILKDLLAVRPDLKLILMSATINADMFSRYFGKAPHMTIPGFAFPVDEYYLEDIYEQLHYIVEEGDPCAAKASKQREYGASKQGAKRKGGQKNISSKSMSFTEQLQMMSEDDVLDEYAERYPGYSRSTIRSIIRTNQEFLNVDLIERLLLYIHEAPEFSNVDGGVLIFLSGLMEIRTVYDKLMENGRFSRGKEFMVLPLHSSLAPQDQQKIFNPAPKGVKKIVLATNIAETSITIDGLRFVIDSGQVKETQYDSQQKMSMLTPTWVSKASAKQRRGRAGRVSHGFCFRLYSQDTYHAFKKHQVAEIQRVPLESLVLTVKILQADEDVQVFLDKAIEPPAKQSVARAIERLMEVRALDDTGELTPLGYHLSSLSVDVNIGKMLIFAAVLQCLDPILTVAACLTHRSPFVSPFDKREEADKVHRSLAVGKSDLLTWLSVFNGWRNARKDRKDREYCNKFFLSHQSLNMISDLRRQFEGELRGIGFVGSDASEHNLHSENHSLLRAVVCAGLYPNVARIKSTTPSLAMVTRDGQEVSVHPCSVNFEDKEFPFKWILFNEKVKTSKVYIRDSTMVSPYALLFFGGTLEVDHQRQCVSVDQWIQFSSPPRIAVLVKELRAETDKLLLQKIESPETNIFADQQDAKVIQAIVALLTQEKRQ